MPFIGELAALATACLWALSACMHTTAARMVGPLALNLYRLPLSLLFFVACGALLGVPWDMPEAAIPWFAASGIVGMGIGDVLFYGSAVRLGTRLSVLLWELCPAVTALFAYVWLGETLTPLGMGGIVLTLLGVVWVLLEKQGDADVDPAPGRFRQGVILGLFSVVAQSLNMVFARHALLYGGDVLSGAVVRTGSAVVALWAVCLLTGWAGRAVAAVRSKPQALRVMTAACIIGPTVGVWLSLVAMRHTKAGIAATLIGLEPLVVIALFAIQERKRPSSRLLTGTVLAVIGSAMLFLR